jgi:hypothetical protein
MENIVMENRMNLTQEDYDYICMFIHLSFVENEYNVGDLENGVIIVTSLFDNTKGYIFKTIENKLYLFHNGETKLI